MQHDIEMLEFFAAYIKKEIGIVYREDAYYQLENRLNTIQALFGFKDLRALYEATHSGLESNIKTNLLDLATNNETSFYRDRKVFQAIEKNLLPQLFSENREINIWSVASSSGQESYSVAMMIEEYLLKNKIKGSYKIIATDISSRILKRAREGAYSQLEVQRGLPAPLLVKYFSRDDQMGHWVVSKELRSKVDFKQQNLVDPFRLPVSFDLVLCRNVLIYQTKEQKEEVLARVGRHLNPGGFLILGSGETLVGLKADYDQNISDGAVVYQKKGEDIPLPRSA